MDCSAPGSWGFSRQGYRRGLPYTPPGDLPNPGVEPRSPTLQVDFLPTELTGKPHIHTNIYKRENYYIAQGTLFNNLITYIGKEYRKNTYTYMHD